MVFGWGRKKQRQKKDAEPDRGNHGRHDGIMYGGGGPGGTTPDQEAAAAEAARSTEVRLADVQGIISDLGRLREPQMISEIRRLRNDTQPLIDELIRIGNVLDGDDLDVDDIDKHLAIIVVRGKRQLIGTIKRDVAHLQDVSSVPECQKLDQSLGIILKKVGDVLGRQSKVIHIFAKKYAGQLKSNLEVMSANHKEIHSILHEYGSSQSAAEEIREMLDQIDALTERHAERARKADEIAKSAARLDAEIATMRESIAREKTGDGYKRHLALRDELGRIAAGRDRIRSDINAQFARISRPLGRYEYQSAALDKEQRGVLEKMVRDPIEAFEPQYKESVTMILNGILKGVSSGSISVKDVDKTRSAIADIKAMADGFAGRISENRKQHDMTEAELESLRPERLMGLQEGLAKGEAARKGLDLKSEAVSSEIDKIRASIPELVSRIQGRLRLYSNTAYTVLPPGNG